MSEYTVTFSYSLDRNLKGLSICFLQKKCKFNWLPGVESEALDMT